MAVFTAATFASLGAWASAAAFAANLVVNIVISTVVNKLFAPKIDQGQGAKDPGVNSRLRINTDNRVGVGYGTFWVKGAEVYGEATTDFKTAYYVMTLCEAVETPGYTASLQQVYWQEFQLTLGMDGWVTGATDANGNPVSDFNNNIRVQFLGNGLPVNRSALPNITQLQTATNTYGGYVLAVVTVNYNRDKQIFRLDDMTFCVSNNMSDPGVVLRDYMTSDRYGCGMYDSQLDNTSLSALSTYSNELLPYTESGGSGTAPRYAINGIVNTNDNCLNNLKSICRNAGSFLRQDNTTGLWGVFIDRPGAAVYQFDATTMIGQTNITTAELNSTPNTVEVLFPQGRQVTGTLDGVYKGQTNSFKLALPDNLVPDGAPINSYTVRYDLCDTDVQAKRLAAIDLNQNSLDLAYTFSANHLAIGVQSGDVIAVTDPANGWSAKLFRVTSVAENEDPNTGNISLEFVCKEYSSTVYNDGTVVSYNPAPNVNNPSARATADFTPAAPTVSGAMPISEVPYFFINVTIPADYRVETIQFYYSTDVSAVGSQLATLTSAEPSGAFIPSSTAQIRITGLPASNYYFRYQLINSSGILPQYSTASAQFAWNPQTSVFVAGIAANPDWVPSFISVPAYGNGTTIMTGQMARLQLFLGTTLANVSNAANANLQANSTWRVNSYSSTANITFTGPTYDETGATWTVATLTTDAAVLTADLEYKDAGGNISELGQTQIQILQNRQGADGANGASGNQYAEVRAYRWEPTTPLGPTGTSTYTWSTGAYSPVPGGWTFLPGNATPGATLWAATIRTSDVGSATMSTINWTTASILPISYAGANGGSGLSRVTYTSSTLGSLDLSPNTITTSGSTTYPPPDSWGMGTVWGGLPPVLVAGQYQYQSDGFYDGATDTTTWYRPYQSALKVGELSAITVNTGNLTVSGTITAGTQGQFSVNNQGSVMITGGPSGSRLEITNDVIKVYDASNIVRIQLGNLLA